MRLNDFIIISSAVGSIILLFLSIAAFHLFGSMSFWLPMTGGGQYFNPHFLTWLLALVPVGALLGCVASVKKQGKRVSWLSCVIGWFVGCIAGYIVFYQTVVFLGVFHPLLVCGLGLVFALFMFWATLKKERAKPAYVKLPM